VNSPSRRDFLVAAGVGAATVGAAVVVPGEADAAGTVPPAATGPLVAYVTDVHRGEITVFVGESAVVVHDADLATRIARAAG
jgi:hypothetical protein